MKKNGEIEERRDRFITVYSKNFQETSFKDAEYYEMDPPLPNPPYSEAQVLWIRVFSQYKKGSMEEIQYNKYILSFADLTIYILYPRCAR